MLSKEICQRCINQRYPENPWGTMDDARWSEGYVFCYDWETAWNKTRTFDEPRKDCPYFLEQTLYSMSLEENKGK